MKFDDFVNNEKVRITTPNISQARSLLKMSANHLNSLKTMSLTQDTASIIFSQSYESLRQVLEAITLLNGYKVYSHEAYTFYLKEYVSEKISVDFDRFRRLRNGINYYGKPIDLYVAVKALERIEQIIEKLKNSFSFSK